MKLSRDIKRILTQTIEGFSKDRGMMLSAALAFYALIAIAPLIAITILIIGAIFRQEAAIIWLLTWAVDNLGPQVAQGLEVVIQAAEERTGIFGYVVNGLIAFFATTVFFAHLQEAINMMWDIPTQPRKGKMLGSAIKKRIISFGLVIGIILFILFSLLITVLISTISTTVTKPLPLILSLPIISTLQYFSFLIATTLIFMLVFTLLPDCKVRLRDIWHGAIVTSTLFVLGQIGISIYFNIMPIGTAFGVAGSFVAVLLWLYYSSLIFLVGAKFTRVYAKMCGHKIIPLPRWSG